MQNYRRAHVSGGCFFFTVNVLERGHSPLVDQIALLREAVATTRRNHPSTIDAFVVLPDHLHAIWTLPPDDRDFSSRWRSPLSCYVNCSRGQELEGVYERPEGLGEHNDSKSAISPKAIAEAIEILDRVARNWVKDVLNYLDKDSRDKALAIQTQLGELRFDSTEFRAVLGSIVEGKFSQTQLDSLGQMLQHTGGDVGGILLGLSDHRAFLDQRLGPQFYEELDTDVRELKENIRKQISELGASKKSKAEKSESANEILHLIERFNSNLAKLRTVLVPPKISPVKEH